MDRKRTSLLKSARLASAPPTISSLRALAAAIGNDPLIKPGDMVWESPVRRLLFRDKKGVAANYRKMFKSMARVECAK